MSNKKQFIGKIVLLFSVIVFIELSLGLATILSHRADQLLAPPKTPPAIPDNRLGDIPNPLYPTHDRNGFRNKKTFKKADIVALGDSQTYGNGVKSKEAWPKQLQSLTGKTVYSMAFGGYGPTHSLMLWNDAMALSPKTVISTLYSGNDLFDSFNHIYNEGQLPELKTPDSKLQAALLQAEQTDSLYEKIGQLFRMGRMPVNDSREATDAAGTTFSPLRLISEHSKIYSLLRRALYEIKSRYVTRGATSLHPEMEWAMLRAFAESNPDYLYVVENGRLKTLLSIEYRLTALELDDPRIFEGLQISLRALQRMHLLAAEKGIRFIVVLIPTKARVFGAFAEKPTKSYQQLLEHGEDVWRISKKFFEDNGIEYLDAFPVLQGQLMNGVMPYPMSHDGHPNKYGHRAIAEFIAENL